MKRRMMMLMSVLAAVALMFSLNSAWAEKAKATGAEIGKAAPSFKLKDQNGKDVSLADYKGKVVVLEWFCATCPAVQRHYANDTQTMKKLAKKYSDKGVVWLAINSSSGVDAAANKKAAEKMGVSYSILDDSSGAIGKAYGAKTTPHMFVVDKAGLLAYSGAIDDDSAGTKGDKAKNYVDAAVGELLAGSTVTTPKTNSYGCGVKYKQ